MSLEAVSVCRATDPWSKARVSSPGQRLQRAANDFLDPDGLAHDAANLVKQRRIGVRPVVFSVADPGHDGEAAAGEPGEFALHGAVTRTGQGDDFVNEETAVRLAEKQTEYALLGRGEQRAGEGRNARIAGTAVPVRRNRIRILKFYTHIRDNSTRERYFQADSRRTGGKMTRRDRPGAASPAPVNPYNAAPQARPRRMTDPP